jgi:tetratricopeptide (TPR) repeat protein
MGIPVPMALPVTHVHNSNPHSKESAETDARASEASGSEYFHLAMRSKNVAAFRRTIRQAESAYSAASHQHRSAKLRGAELRCHAWILYLRFFLATRASTKMRFLQESWRLTRLALDIFGRDANYDEFADTYAQLSATVGLEYDLHWDLKARLRKVDEGIDYGRKAITHLSPSSHKKLFTKICVILALFFDIQGDYPTHYDIEKIDREALGYWKTAEKLDRRTALLQVGYPPPGFYRLLSDSDGARVCNDALKLARVEGDNFAIGWQLDQATVRRFFEAFRPLGDSEKNRVAREALGLAEEAQYRHSLVNFVTPNCGVLYPGSPYVEYFKQLSLFEKDPAKRRALLTKSLRETPHLLTVARSSGYPVVNAYAQRMVSGILLELAGLVTDPEEKRRMLQESLKHCLKAERIVMKSKGDELGPVGTMLRALSRTKAALADLEPTYRAKVRLLRAAVKDSDRDVLLYTKYVEILSKGQPHALHKMLGRHQLGRGDLLTRLYNVTKNEALLARIARNYSDAAITLRQGDLKTDLGLAYWKAAEAYDLQQANVAAAESFGLAAKTYQSIKDRNPRIVSIFHDYAKYMEAWSNIELARAAHRRSAHDEAEKFYDRAASLHSTARRWSFLAPYYAAFAKLESAENLSRNGDSSAAQNAFSEAADRFRESSALLRKELTSFNEAEEKLSIERLATSFSEEYCRGRMLIEGARQAEDQADHQTSAEQFDEAALIFAKVARSKNLKREKNDLLYISTLAKAWGEMARSYKMRDSTRGFRNAISLFEKSLDYSPDEYAKNASLGHQHFCHALAASEEFNYTLDLSDYEKAAKHFTAASAHFASAGFNIQSTHVQACKLLLDARAELSKSNKDPDPVGGARGYERAAELLQVAADAFARSHQKAKQGEVLSLLESVNERHGFVKRLATASKTVSRVSPTVAFPTPARGEESPFGHSRFTGSQIDVDYTSSATSDGGATEVSVELRVSNIGTEPIQIVRISDALPYAARVTSVSPNVAISHGAIVPARKDTVPMNVEIFRWKLDVRNGPAIVKPIIIYFDEKGREHSYELAPQVVASSPMLDYLVKEFVTDYTERRLAPEHSGWRTLTNIGGALKVPRSHLYGEPRWGHAYGRPLETLVNSGIVECRTFPGERGRGGQILKVRFAHATEIARRYLEGTQRARADYSQRASGQLMDHLSS